MISTILEFLLGRDGIFVWLGALVLAAFAYGVRSGKGRAEAKQAASEAKARDISDEIDDAIAGRSPDKNREALKKWSAR